MAKTKKKQDPVFLVVVDDSEEMHQALQFACGRAEAVGGKVALLYCIAPSEFEYFAGVGELMRAEAREAVGWVVFGGLGLTAFFTLFLTPVIYLGVARFSKPRADSRQKLEQELEVAQEL